MDQVAITLRLHALAAQAEGAGGGLIRLLGNHEVMNYQADFRYDIPCSCFFLVNFNIETHALLDLQ
jgi:hypothetical protein